MADEETVEPQSQDQEAPLVPDARRKSEDSLEQIVINSLRAQVDRLRLMTKNLTQENVALKQMADDLDKQMVALKHPPAERHKQVLPDSVKGAAGGWDRTSSAPGPVDNSDVSDV